MDGNLKYAQAFEEKHAAKGGLDKLHELYERGLSDNAIAAHFDVSAQGIRYAMQRILGERYIRYPLRRDLPKLREMFGGDR